MLKLIWKCFHFWAYKWLWKIKIIRIFSWCTISISSWWGVKNPLTRDTLLKLIWKCVNFWEYKQLWRTQRYFYGAQFPSVYNTRYSKFADESFSKTIFFAKIDLKICQFLSIQTIMKDSTIFLWCAISISPWYQVFEILWWEIIIKTAYQPQCGNAVR